MVVVPNTDVAGTVTLRVKDISDLQVTAPINGADNTMTVDPSQRAQVGFTAVKGQRFRVAMTASTIGYWDQRVRVVAPDGTLVSETQAGAGSRWYVEDAQAGVYKVVVVPNTDVAGTVTVRVKDISDLQITAPTTGTDNTVTVDPSQRAQITFPAEAGERFRVTMPASTIGYWDQRVRVVAPDGTVVSETQAAAGSRWYVDNAQAGTYRVVVVPNTDVAGTVTLRVKDISDLRLIAVPNGADTPVTLEPWQRAQVSFDVVQGRRYTVSLPASSIGYWDQRLRVYAPDGGLVVDTQASAGGAWAFDAAQAGAYRVELAPNVDVDGTGDDPDHDAVTVPAGAARERAPRREGGDGEGDDEADRAHREQRAVHAPGGGHQAGDQVAELWARSA